MMGDVFPELKDNEKKIQDMIRDEEQSFENTLAKGYEKFKKAADAVKENGGTVLSGQASVLSFFNSSTLLNSFSLEDLAAITVFCFLWTLEDIYFFFKYHVEVC